MGRADLRVAAVAAAAFVALTVLVAAGWGPLVELDGAIADNANTFAAAHPGWVRAMRFWTNAAGPLTWRLLMVGVAVLLLVRRNAPAAAFTFGAIAIGAVLSTAIKVGVDRARPAIPHPYANAAGMSFPSGHASTAAVACGIVLLLVLPSLHGAWRVLAWALAVIVAAAVGYTRIGLDVHWTSDVVGGWLLGMAVVAAAHAAFRPALSGPRSRGQALGSSPVSRW